MSDSTAETKDVRVMLLTDSRASSYEFRKQPSNKRPTYLILSKNISKDYPIVFYKPTMSKTIILEIVFCC